MGLGLGLGLEPYPNPNPNPSPNPNPNPSVQVAPADAANSSVHAVCRAALDRLHGQYLERCVPVAPSAAALDEQLEREITARSDALVAPWLRPVDAHTS